MRKFLIITIIPFLSGCSATMESTLSKSTPNAPVNEINGGIVSYPNEGRYTDYSRRDAYKKMHDYCKGDYKILEEGEHVGFGMASPVGDTVLYDNQRTWKIKFECAH